MHKSKKRILSLFLAAVMLLLLPADMLSAGLPNSQNGPVRVQQLNELRESNSDTYLLSDGSYECVVYADDKYYKDDSGRYVEIDHSIVRMENTNSNKSYAYKNTAGAANAFFAEVEPRVCVEANGSSLSFCLNGANRTSAKAGEASAKRSVHNYELFGKNYISYENVLNGTDLIYEMLNGCLKEYVLLKDKSVPTEYMFIFYTPELAVMKTENGTVEFISASNETVFELGSLFAVDSNGEYTDALEYSLEETGKSGEYKITVSISEDYLNDPQRAFPVLVDPSINIYGADKTYDTFVSSKNGCANKNYYTDPLLRVGKCSEFAVCRSFISFKLPSSVIGATVTEGYIRLKKNSGAPTYARPYKVLESWQSKYVTWFNQPLYDDNHTVGSLILDTNNWYKIALNALVQEWCQKPTRNYGIALCSVDESSTAKYAEFCSSDYGYPNRPELHIVYNAVNTVSVRKISDIAFCSEYPAYRSKIDDYMSKMAGPFKRRWNIEFSHYSWSDNRSLPASQCTLAHNQCCHDYQNVCGHACVDGTTTPNHHKNHYRNWETIYGWGQGNADITIAFLGFSPCAAGGLSYGWLSTVCQPNLGYWSAEYNVNTLRHEVSHLFGCLDGACSPGQPCIMNGGFDNTDIYPLSELIGLTDIWCQNCQNRFDRNAH